MLSKRLIFAFSALLGATGLLSVTSCAYLSEKEQMVAQVEIWPELNAPALDPAVEARVDAILGKMSVEQKVGQVIQADTNSVRPEEVRQYRLGSVLSGGNSAPGDEPYAETTGWLEAADAYFEASIDPEGVEIAIPIIWGIDAVHGHANLTGATVFPHNIGLGAANNPDLIEDIMEVTAAELIVSGHDWTFAPTLAVPRDDRWGRSYEGFSEDPKIVASYGDRIVYGLQGLPETDQYFDHSSVIASAKHFVGDGGTTKGVDQGDTAISEEVLRDIHAQGYFPAIEAGVQTIMASFNSWNGSKMHGDTYMLTDVLKDRMGFNGFVVGDWNGHGQLPGCTNTDCPAAFNAGVDMYMAPDSWKGVYHSTLAAVESGEISLERLDDAVRRILRVKIVAGVFEKPKPSERSGAGDEAILGSATHRAIARQAVRESLVLLKNDGEALPLKADMTVLVVGDGAHSIAKQSGGWTLSWQGGGYENADFPHGQSILDGIREAVHAGGGRVVFDPAGKSLMEADAVIAVYGEDPYAEFQGDRDNLDFVPNGFDPKLLEAFQSRGVPTVSVFLSGRPLWVNPELNASDAFVAAWLPGTEGGGVADVLFQTQPEFDFRGGLSFSWPKTAMDFDNNEGADGYDPLFPLGYGLSYGEPVTALGVLPEESGVDVNQLAESGAVFRRGGAISPWKVFLMNDEEAVLFNGTGANVDGLNATRTDHIAQEDAMALAFSSIEARLAFVMDEDGVDWSQPLADGKAFSVAVKAGVSFELSLGFECGEGGEGGECAATQVIDVPEGDWREVQLPLGCIAGRVDVSDLSLPIAISVSKPISIAIADVRLANNTGSTMACAE